MTNIFEYNFLPSVKKLLLWESDQKPDHSNSIINRILYSSRLLIDHTQSFELCLEELQPKLEQKSHVIFLNGTIFMSAGIIASRYGNFEKKIANILLKSCCTGLSLLFAIKTYQKFQHYLIDKALSNFIKSLNQFSTCIKNNICYFNELQTMQSINKSDKAEVESKYLDRAWKCIRSIKKNSILIYHRIKDLEKSYKLSSNVSEFYWPMENILESYYFTTDVTDYNFKHVKEFYNIFIYVQSHYLFLIALLTLQNSPVNSLRKDLKILTEHLQQAVQEDNEYFKNLLSEIQKSKTPSALSHRNTLHQFSSLNHKDFLINIIQETSLKLNSSLYAIAEECQNLNTFEKHLDDLNNEKLDIKVLLDIENTFKLIENSLSVCCDDFRRQVLIYNKFLNEKLKRNSKENLLSEFIQPENINSNSDSNFSQSEENENFDAFFGVVDHEEQHIDKDGDNLDEIYNLDKKLTQKKFKPVLKQLRNRIHPIRQEMNEKEKNVLLSKGIDINQLVDDKNDEKSDDGDIDTESDESKNSSTSLQKKKLKKRQKHDIYAEMREFLAQKQPTNIFGNASNFQLPKSENNTSEYIFEE